MAEIKAFFDEDTNTLTYLVWDPVTMEAAVIDPVLDFEPASATLSTRSADKVLEAVTARGLTLKWALETHAHADHLTAAHYIQEKTGARTGIGDHINEVQATFAPRFNAKDVKSDGSQFDHLFTDGETFNIGQLEVRVMHTPGHTPACITYLVDDAAFVGDTLFMPDYGTARADFPGGDARTLFKSIQKLLSLPQTTRIFVGHDYPSTDRPDPAWEATVADQKAHNKHVREGVTEEDFTKWRAERDATLAAPRLILPSLQVNIRAGEMPPKDDDGNIYFKLPVSGA